MDGVEGCDLCGVDGGGLWVSPIVLQQTVESREAPS